MRHVYLMLGRGQHRQQENFRLIPEVSTDSTLYDGVSAQLLANRCDWYLIVTHHPQLKNEKIFPRFDSLG